MTSRPSVQRLPAYSPGMSVPGKIKMASNENPLGMSPRALEALTRHAAEAFLYPDGAATTLRNAIAERYGLESDEVILGNGSDEVIFFAAATWLNPGEEVLVADHTFSEYRFSSTLMDGQVRTVALRNGSFVLDDFLEAISPSTRMIFLCSPNNPTGTIIRQSDFEAFMDRVPAEIMVLMDQAYAEFVTDSEYGDCPSLVRRYPNLLVTRTFSKLYGMAGLRMGYGLGSRALISELFRVKPPFNTSNLSQHAALAAWGDQDYIQRSLGLNLEGRNWIQSRLELLGLPYYPSQSNFVCIDTLRDAKAVFDHIFQKGIILRPCGSFGLPTCIRISVGTMEQNRRCIALLEEALAAISPGGPEPYIRR